MLLTEVESTGVEAGLGRLWVQFDHIEFDMPMDI